MIDINFGQLEKQYLPSEIKNVGKIIDVKFEHS
jgi:hypothetical protein